MASPSLGVIGGLLDLAHGSSTTGAKRIAQVLYGRASPRQEPLWNEAKAVIQISPGPFVECLGHEFIEIPAYNHHQYYMNPGSPPL